MIELKSLYRKIEACFAGTAEARTPHRLAARLAPAMLDHLGGTLSLAAAHLYVVKDGALGAGGRWGESRPDLTQALEAHLAAPDPPPWVLETPAGRAGALRVGAGAGPLVALFGPHPGDLRPEPGRTEFASALHSLQYAIERHLDRGEMENAMEQARAIQQSLLPPSRVVFDGYDAFATSIPASQVGGDLYDFVPLESDVLALVVADASGHGLPAALQARDVAMGVRMGLERDLKITRLVAKLNRIIHRSGMVSRFISLWIGELEENGNLTYVNAGHPPGLLLDDRGVHELAVGGPLLGPLSDASYKLGFTHVDRGAALVLYSDGLVECRNREGEEFGEARVREWLLASRERDAESSVAELLQRLRDHHGRRQALEDDVTVMLVRRPRG